MIQITLKAARVNVGLSQKEAAKALGISQNTLIKWEKYPDVIPPFRQSAISAVYRMPIDNIIFLPKN